MRAAVATFCVVCAFLAGCAEPAGTGFVVGAAGGRATYTNVTHPELIGTTLDVPPAALGQTVTLQIAPCDDLVQGEERAVGPCVRLLPVDLVFAKPVTLTLPYRPAELNERSTLEVRSGFLGASNILVIPPRAMPQTRTVTTAIRTCGDYQVVSRTLPPVPSEKVVDVLFVIDNSSSMSVLQKALVKNFPRFLQQLDDVGANYHLGIVTSDIGSDVKPGQLWGGNSGSCDTFAGDDGILQAVACTTRAGTTSDARNDCASVCADDRFVPTNGNSFIAKSEFRSNVPPSPEFDPRTGKLVDLGPLRALQCMAMVGDAGCGIEAPLEAARRALDGHLAENSGFLRPNSLLVVIYLTDEDDCSVQVARRAQNSPLTRDCDPTQPDAYDCYNPDFRCLARSVSCDQSLLTAGAKTNCKERPDNYLEPITKYQRFFSNLRPPTRLIIKGIWAQPSIDRGGQLVVAQSSGGTGTATLNRAPGAGAACVYSGSMAVFGQAQRRLSQFITGLQMNFKATESSVCDLDHYGSALDEVAQEINDRFSG